MRSATTVILAESGGRTMLEMRELHPSKEALDTAGTGVAEAQLDPAFAGNAAARAAGRLRKT